MTKLDDIVGDQGVPDLVTHKRPFEPEDLRKQEQEDRSAKKGEDGLQLFH